MTDDTFISHWYIAWCLVLACTAAFWSYIVHTIPRTDSPLVLLTLLFGYPFCVILSLFCFAAALRSSPYDDLGFWFSIALPTLVFWLASFALVYGILKTSLAIVVTCRKRLQTRAALRALWPYTTSLVAMHLAFAAAYSCTFGMGLSPAVILPLWYQRSVLPERKDKRERKKWE
jgi:hypothetical protein